MQSLVVFSHLRWNFVYQRPQHLLSRIAARWPVVFIEEPIPGAPSDHIEFIAAAPGVEVWRPHLRGTDLGLPSIEATMRHLLGQAFRRRKVEDYWLWFYTPMALPLAEGMEPEGIIYDCMDELSMFKGAPPQLLEQEAALFRTADIVFTGGRSLYNAKRGCHPDVHCFPSSVDALHFRPGAKDHPLQSGLPQPRMGYCGVIDERIDLELIAGIANARPDWQLVMVGPTAKIDPAGLPRRPNIHWLGQQNYADLPAFINGWDICLLPFALNDATRFISPTKTLEYMACGKPCVSTAIRDVVEPYGHVVPIRADAAGFIEACEAIMRRPQAERKAWQSQIDEIIAGTSWDATAARMMGMIDKARAARNAKALPTRSGVTAELRLGTGLAAAS
jgi:glycosyltransferase involved in cell wall biosynthesis